MIRFTKMQGAGNDFICLDGVSDPALAKRDDLGQLAAAMGDRRFGVGADGLILISLPDPIADVSDRSAVKMRMFNADGTESPMCGNGIRCVAKYAVEHDLVRLGSEPVLTVQTGSGQVEAKCRVGADGVEAVTVDMGEPILEPRQIPIDLPRRHKGPIADFPLGKYIPLNAPAAWMEECGLDLRMTCISMGNPHVVIYCACVEAVPLATVGPFIERQPIFPDRINVHFVQVLARDEVRVRSWERGCGATMACGSGACAVCVAGVLTNRADRRLLAHLPGGDLELRWDEQTNHVRMTGPAEEVFSGTWATADKLIQSP